MTVLTIIRRWTLSHASARWHVSARHRTSRLSMDPTYVVCYEHGIMVAGAQVAPRVISSLVTTEGVLGDRCGPTPRAGDLTTIFIRQGRRGDDRRRDIDAPNSSGVTQMSEVILWHRLVTGSCRLQRNMNGMGVLSVSQYRITSFLPQPL
jgi:hypothetical protein